MSAAVIASSAAVMAATAAQRANTAHTEACGSTPTEPLSDTDALLIKVGIVVLLAAVLIGAWRGWHHGNEFASKPEAAVMYSLVSVIFTLLCAFCLAVLLAALHFLFFK